MYVELEMRLNRNDLEKLVFSMARNRLECNQGSVTLLDVASDNSNGLSLVIKYRVRDCIERYMAATRD